MVKCHNCGKKISLLGGYAPFFDNKRFCNKTCHEKHKKNPTPKKEHKEQSGIPERQQDAIVAAIISAVVMGLLYFFVFKHIFDLFGIGTGLRWIIMIFFWGAGTGLGSAMTSMQKAHQKIAYGK